MLESWVCRVLAFYSFHSRIPGFGDEINWLVPKNQDEKVSQLALKIIEITVGVISDFSSFRCDLEVGMNFSETLRLPRSCYIFNDFIEEKLVSNKAPTI